jgi:hypothetical protein
MGKPCGFEFASLTLPDRAPRGPGCGCWRLCPPTSSPRSCAARSTRTVLNPHGERTAPPGLYWPGADEQSRPAYGLGGPDPTSGT